ncbi:MAG: hypothetical protein AB7L91_16810 [Dehalococcoidia bacterium]
MQIYDAGERKVLAEARADARGETGWLAFHAAFTAFLVWVALSGATGVPVVMWWFAAGVVFSDVLTSLRHTVGAWREVRALSGCPDCLAESVEMAEASTRRARCGVAGHPGMSR